MDATTPARILVVEDERKVANALADGLGGEGYDVTVEHTGDGAIARLAAVIFDVVLLDLMLPDRDGFQVLTSLRANRTNTRVLVLTARDALEDRVAGLDRGADDYLVKPFVFAELLARIRALLRRGRVTEGPQIEVGDLQMDLVTRKVTRAGQTLDLTLREFEVLEYLLRHAGEVVSRATLGDAVWKETSRSTTLDNVMDVHMARLRRKVDYEQPVKLIWTVRGVGFMIREGEA